MQRKMCDQSESADRPPFLSVASPVSSSLSLDSDCHQVEANLPFSINRLLQSTGIEAHSSSSPLTFANSPCLFGKFLSNFNFNKSFASNDAAPSQLDAPLMTPFSWITPQMIKPGVSSKFGLETLEGLFSILSHFNEID